MDPMGLKNHPIGNIIYIPGTQMTLILIENGLVLGGWPSKIEVIWVPGIYHLYLLWEQGETTIDIGSPYSGWDVKGLWRLQMAWTMLWG